LYSVGTGYVGERYQLTTAATLKTPDAQVFTSVQFANAGTYTANSYFLDGTYSFRRRPFIFSVSNILRYAQIDYTDASQNVRLSMGRFLWNPTGAIALDLGEQQRLTLAVARTQSLPTPQDLMAGYVVTDYRSLNRGTPVLNVVNSDAIILRFNDFGFTRHYTILANVLASRETNPYVYQLNITNSLSLFRTLPYNSSVYQYGAKTEVARFAQALNVRFQLDGDASITNLVNFQGEDLISSRLAKVEAGIAGVTAFDQAVNAELGTRFTILRLTDNATDQTTDGLQRSLFIRPRFVLKIRPTKTTRFRLVNEWVHWENGPSVSNLFLTDGTFTWTPPKKPYSLELIGNNLLNVNTFNYTQFTGNYLITQRQFMLQPRYVSIRAEWRF
jgi:hypothetical protein